MKKRDTRGDTPSRDQDDALRIKSVEHPFHFRDFSNEPEITSLIVDAVNRMSGAGETAEKDYQTCIDRLHRNAKLVSRIIQSEYFDLPEDAYLDRWALVMLAVELADNQNLDFFGKILASQIPEEKSKDPHSFTSAGEEVMIRTTVIEGLERMGAEGDKKAIKLLSSNINHESFSIRRAATQALISIGGDEVRKKLEEELPKRHHDLLRIRRADVREAEQAEGGLFLKSRDEDETPAPNEGKSDKKSDS